MFVVVSIRNGLEFDLLAIDELVVDPTDHDRIAIFQADLRENGLNRANFAIAVENVPFLDGIPALSQDRHCACAAFWSSLDPTGILDACQDIIGAGGGESVANVGDGIDVGVERQDLESSRRVAAGECLAEGCIDRAEIDQCKGDQGDHGDRHAGSIPGCGRIGGGCADDRRHSADASDGRSNAANDQVKVEDQEQCACGCEHRACQHEQLGSAVQIVVEEAFVPVVRREPQEHHEGCTDGVEEALIDASSGETQLVQSHHDAQRDQ